MKIKNTVLTVTAHVSVPPRTDAVIDPSGQVREERIRRYYHRALKRAAAAGHTTITFVVDEAGLDPVVLLATAKILAQEIYRLLHEDAHSLSAIVISAKGRRAYAACKKNALGYMDYIENKLKSPFLTVDAIIEYKGSIVLIKRSNPPFGWAIPGGFVDYGESLEAAVIREAKEETDLDICDVRQMHTYSDPKRDPRFHTVCTVFCAKGKGTPRAGDDAAGIMLAKPKDLKKIGFAFNHGDVLQDYLKFKAGKDPY